MQFRHKQRPEEFGEIVRGIGLKWWFAGLVGLWILCAGLAGLSFF